MYCCNAQILCVVLSCKAQVPSEVRLKYSKHFPETIYRLWFCLLIHYFKPRQRIFHLYGYVTSTGEGLQNLGLCSEIRAFEQGGIFIEPYTCCDTGPRFSADCPHSVASHDMQGDTEELFLPGPSRVLYFYSLGNKYESERYNYLRLDAAVTMPLRLLLSHRARANENNNCNIFLLSKGILTNNNCIFENNMTDFCNPECMMELILFLFILFL
jgi:hypothetical protein